MAKGTTTRLSAQAAFAEAELRISQCIQVSALELDLSRLDNLEELPIQIQSLPTLRKLDLTRTQISDLTRLPLQLEQLDLTATQIVDFSPLRRLTELRDLTLWKTGITDLAPLLALNKLRRLVLWQTPTTDWGVLGNLITLQNLDLDQTAFTDLALLRPLKGTLKTLYLAQTKVSDLTPLRDFNNLLGLHIAGTLVTDLSPLRELQDLRILRLGHTNVRDLSPIALLKDMDSLSFEYTPISDISVVKNFRSLQSLNLSGTAVSDLSPIAELSELATAAEAAPNSSGLDFLKCESLSDPTLRGFAELANPERTIQTLEFLSKHRLPASTRPSPETVEPQSPTTLIFAPNVDTGRIDLSADAGAPAIRDDVVQRQLYESLRESIELFLARCSPGQPGSNQLGVWRDLTQQMGNALGSELPEIQPGLAVLRGNALRIALETDSRRRIAKDPDVEPMPEGATGDMQTLVETWNVFVGSDPFLDTIDSRRLGPDARRHEAVLAAETAAALSDAQNLNITTDVALAALRDAERLAQDATTAADRAFAFQLEALRNFSREVLRLALVALRPTARLAAQTAKVAWDISLKPAIQKASEEFGKEFGKRAAQGITLATILPYLTTWIVGNASWLSSLFANSPNMRSIIDYFLKN